MADSSEYNHPTNNRYFFNIKNQQKYRNETLFIRAYENASVFLHFNGVLFNIEKGQLGHFVNT